MAWFSFEAEPLQTFKIPCRTSQPSVEEVAARVTRLKPMGAGAVGVTGMPAALASLVTAHWTDILVISALSLLTELLMNKYLDT